MKITQPLAIILKERETSAGREKAGWIIILAGQDHRRELLAVLTPEVGFEAARQFAAILAAKFGVKDVLEESFTAPNQFQAKGNQ